MNWPGSTYWTTRPSGAVLAKALEGWLTDAPTLQPPTFQLALTRYLLPQERLTIGQLPSTDFNDRCYQLSTYCRLMFSFHLASDSLSPQRSWTHLNPITWYPFAPSWGPVPSRSLELGVGRPIFQPTYQSKEAASKAGQGGDAGQRKKKETNPL